MPGGKIFISYRRGADNGVAGHLHTRLERQFDRDRLFFDIDAIPLGRDFPDYLDEQVARCEVFMAVIGPGWIAEIDRLGDAGDFVRIEIEAALRRPDIPIIPVLLEGVEMPGTDDLPEVLHPLTRRNGLRIDHHHFAQSVDGTLTASLREMLGDAGPGATDPHVIAGSDPVHRDLGHPLARSRILSVGGLILATGAAVVAILLGMSLGEQDQTQPNPDDPDTVMPYEPPKITKLEGVITFSSDDGDWIGDGKDRQLTDDDGNITATTDGNLISISYEGDDDWSLELAAPEGELLALGDFPGASRYPFNSPKKPGISISGDGRGCNEVSGMFAVDELLLDDTRQHVILFAARFEQSCDGGPVLTGMVKVSRIE
ncbi:MAG: toll/interleukin-1 receptor domain-containing protein [Pseudomonadota bacterium]